MDDLLQDMLAKGLMSIAKQSIHDADTVYKRIKKLSDTKPLPSNKAHWETIGILMALDRMIEQIPLYQELTWHRN